MKKALKLHKTHLRVGKPLPWDVYDHTYQLLLSRGYVIDKESQLEALIQRGVYVDAQEFESAAEKPKGEEPIDPFWLWDDLTAKLGALLTRQGDPEQFPQRTRTLANSLQALVQRSPDAAVAIIMLTLDHRRYPLVHSLQVATLCDMLSNRMGWTPERRMSLLCAALTMNVGMQELQQQLACQREPLTLEQQRRIREHPEKSGSILRLSGVDSAEWLSAVENHHETTQGTGYPQGIHNLPEEAVLLRTLDVFCAKVSPRQYRKPMSGTQAERILFSDKDLACNNPFVPALIKEIGVYPPGSFVRLANGEIAIVHRRGGDARTPQVLSVINTRGEPLIEPIRRDSSRDGFQIVADVPRETVPLGFDPSRFWTEQGTASLDRRRWA